MTNKEVTSGEPGTSRKKKQPILPPAKLRAKLLRPPIISSLWSTITCGGSSSDLECGRGLCANQVNLQADFGAVLSKSTPYEPRTLSSSQQQRAMNYYEKQRTTREPQPYLEPVSAWSGKDKQQDSVVMDLKPEPRQRGVSSAGLQTWTSTVPPPRVLRSNPKQRKERVLSDFGSLAAQQQRSDLAYLVVDLQDPCAERVTAATGTWSLQLEQLQQRAAISID